MKKRLPVVLSFAAFAAVLAAVLAFLWSGAFVQEFQCDTTDTLLWAEAARDAGRLVNPDFAYCYVIPLGGQLLMLPFLGKLGVGLDSIRAGMTLFILLFSASLVAFFRSFRMKAPAALLSSAFVLSCLSATVKMREIFFTHTLFYSLAALGIALAFSLLPEDRSGRGGKWEGGLLFLVLAWAGSCGTPLALYLPAPLLCALCAIRLADPAPLGSTLRRDVRLPAAVVLGTVAGLAFHRWISTGVHADYGEMFQTLAPQRAWGGHLVGLLGQWSSLFCDMPKNLQFSALSPIGLRCSIRLAFSLFLPALAVVAALRWRSLRPKTRLFLLFHFFMSSMLLFFFLFGNIGNVNWRLTPLVFSNLLLAPLLAAELARGEAVARRFAALLCIALAVFALLFAGILANKPAAAARMLPAERAWDGPTSLLPLLEKLDVDYAYCYGFWFANAVTAVSNGRIPVREVGFLEKKGWVRRSFQNNAKWYLPDPARKRTALVCPPELEPFAPAERRIGVWPCRQADYRNQRWTDLVAIVYDGDFPIPCRPARPDDASVGDPAPEP